MIAFSLPSHPTRNAFLMGSRKLAKGVFGSSLLVPRYILNVLSQLFLPAPENSMLPKCVYNHMGGIPKNESVSVVV